MTDGLRRGAYWALSGYGLFLAFILLGPSASVPISSVSFLARIAYAVGISPELASPSRVELVSNVLIIVPVGLLGSLVWPRLNWRDWIACGFVLSGSVELLQAVALSHRSATFVDVVANTLGAGLGAGLAAVALRVSQWRPE